MDVSSRDLAILLRSRHPLIVCETIEEKRFEALLRAVAGELAFPFSTWSAASGLSPCAPADQPQSLDLAFSLRLIRTIRGTGVWLLKDAQAPLENPATLRTLREVAQEFAGTPRTLVLVAPSFSRRPELEDIQVRFEFGLPGDEELRALVKETMRKVARENPRVRIDLSPEEAEGLVADLHGLTLFEAERALARAIVEDDALTGADRVGVREAKKTLVQTGGLLDFVAAPERLDQVGGLARLKRWLATRRVGFLPQSGESPLDPPKGILLLGVQGCGKSLAAKAVASSWDVPLLAMDAGRMLAPYIGESERNLRDALRRVERMAPCVLWVDEIEKAFAASRSSESDGGVSRRLLAAFLTWMQERDARVFLVATANSVEDLPPEMMRKGRFDEIFFLDLPGRSAREEIFRIHLVKRRQDPERFDLRVLAEASEGFSGAEIEQIVVSALYESRATGAALDMTCLLVSIRSTRPLSRIRAETIGRLRAWAAGRCVFADRPDNGSGTAQGIPSR